MNVISLRDRILRGSRQPEQKPYQQDYPEQPDQYQTGQELPQEQSEQSPFVPSEHYTQQMPNVYYQEQDKSPLSVLEEIRKYPTQKGTFATIIGGRPVDLHELEDYLLKASPYGLKTILRYHNARTIEEIKNYSRIGGAGKLNTKFWLMLILFIGLAIVGIAIIIFLPQIMGFFSGAAGGVSGK